MLVQYSSGRDKERVGIIGYFAHAGQSDLLNFVLGIPDAPREIRLVHGDDGAKAALKVVLGQALKMKPEPQVVIAE